MLSAIYSGGPTESLYLPTNYISKLQFSVLSLNLFRMVPDSFLFWTPWTPSARKHCGIPEDVISICKLGFPPFLLACSDQLLLLPFSQFAVFPLFYKISSESISVLITDHQWKPWISSISVVIFGTATHPWELFPIYNFFLSSVSWYLIQLITCFHYIE